MNLGQFKLGIWWAEFDFVQAPKPLIDGSGLDRDIMDVAFVAYLPKR